MSSAKPSRRQFVAAVTAAAAMAAMPGARAALAQAGDNPRIIDTHHHIYPPQYVAPNLQRIVTDSNALPASAYLGT